MKMTNEEMILDKNFRLSLIEEIEGPENRQRKLEAFKRYEILKDRIKKYILQNLMEELDADTVKDMQSRIATVNIYKKVVGKKARVYRTAPKRVATEGTDQEQLDKFAAAINLNVSMKKANRYLEAMLNTDVFVRPIKDVTQTTEQGAPKWKYRIDPMAPHSYDAIEDANDPERAMGYIFSPFHALPPNVNDNPQNRERNGLVSNFRDGDQKDQAIADSPADKKKEYVWWGNKFHLTFDEEGTIVANKTPQDALNPIGVLPVASLAKDRDGSFWALGGEDLIEGSILINTILSDIYFIAKMHGTGLFYLFGKGVPKSYKVGANQAITLDVQEGDPTPTIGFANANPQLEEHARLVEQYLAILLTTNDLEPGSVQGELSGTSAASGVQEMIIKAEPMGSVEDDQEIFRDAEPEVVNICAKWHNLYLDKGLLIDDLARLGKMPDKIEYAIKFGAVAQFINEKEKLDVIEKRLELELDDMIDALILDNPDLSTDEAKKIVEEREREKLKKAKEAMAQMIKDGVDANNEDENQLQPEPSKGNEKPNALGKDES